jgi:1-phosphofructokinase
MAAERNRPGCARHPLATAFVLRFFTDAIGARTDDRDCVRHQADPPRVTVFGPDPLLSIAIERRGDGQDDVHLHPGGQGVWIATVAAEHGAHPVLCALLGGETGAILAGLLGTLSGERRIVQVNGANGSYIVDRRRGTRRVIASTHRPAPQRHELDDLIGLTSTAALGSRVLVVANPFPAEGFPPEVYDVVVASVKAVGIPVLVDLSSPRLDHVLPHQPELVKLNDWELAEYVSGPVDGRRALDAARRIQDAGARSVAVTRGAGPILVLPAQGDPFEIVPPRFPIGFREGCGDTMMGATAAAWARGLGLRDALVLGAAAGSANFLRHGLGTGTRATAQELAAAIVVRPLIRTAA